MLLCLFVNTHSNIGVFFLFTHISQSLFVYTMNNTYKYLKCVWECLTMYGLEFCFCNKLRLMSSICVTFNWFAILNEMCCEVMQSDVSHRHLRILNWKLEIGELNGQKRRNENGNWAVCWGRRWFILNRINDNMPLHYTKMKWIECYFRFVCFCL